MTVPRIIRMIMSEVKVTEDHIFFLFLFQSSKDAATSNQTKIQAVFFVSTDTISKINSINGKELNKK